MRQILQKILQKKHKITMTEEKIAEINKNSKTISKSQPTREGISEKNVRSGKTEEQIEKLINKKQKIKKRSNDKISLEEKKEGEKMLEIIEGPIEKLTDRRIEKQEKIEEDKYRANKEDLTNKEKIMLEKNLKLKRFTKR